MSDKLFIKDNKPRGKWDRKIKLPSKGLSSKNLSFWQKVRILLGQPIKVLEAGILAIANDNPPLIKDKRYVNRLSTELGEYLHWYFSSKGFLQSIDWMGIPSRKMPTDMWIYQEIIVETKPDFIIEIGTFYGGSALFLAQTCDGINNGTIITVDISHDFYMAEHSRILTITGDCSDSGTLKIIKDIVKKGTVMVIHDGDHTASAVARDLELYAPLVSPGMYLIVEDGIVDLFNPATSKLGKSYIEGGPLKASRDFLKKHVHEFELDMRRERFILTSNPEGYLRRKTN